MSKSKELRGTLGELQLQWSCSEVPEKSGFVEKPRQRSKTAAVVVVVVEGSGGELSRQPTEETESQRKSVFFLKKSGLELVSKKTRISRRTCRPWCRRSRWRRTAAREDCSRIVREAPTREGQRTATPNRAVRSELSRGSCSKVYYYSHES